MEDHLRLRDDRVVLGGRVLLLLGVWTLDLGDREMFIIAVNGNLVNRGVGRVEGGRLDYYVSACHSAKKCQLPVDFYSRRRR